MIVPVRGKWAFPKRKRGGRIRRAHIMSNDGISFCGRRVSVGEIMDDDWNPEEHDGVICERCLKEWWIPVLKRRTQPHKATNEPKPAATT